MRAPGFIRSRPARRWVHSGSLGSYGRGMGVVGFIRERPRGGHVHSGSLD